MKRILTLCIAISCGVAAMAQNNDNKTPFLTKSLAGDAISNVDVSTSAGGITVSGASGEAPRVEVYIQGNNNKKLTKEEIQQRLDDNYDLDVTVNGHELRAVAKNKHDNMDGNKGLSISFKIYVPEETSTHLRTSGGGIQLDNLKGNEDFNTSGGGLMVDKLSGMVHGRTSGGGIIVSNSDNDIDLETSGGGIIAKNCKGSIKLVTSGGGLVLQHLDGNITAHTSGGGIACEHINGELVTGTSGGGIAIKGMNGSLEANSSAGSVDVEMEHVGKYLKLNTSAGNIALKLPAKEGLDLHLSGEKISDQENGAFKGTWSKKSVDGSINGGGVPVNVHANDNISVTFD